MKTIKGLWLLCLLTFAAAIPGRAWAFPEMVRHGYLNCTACHASPAGGGILTAYGRGTTQSVLSTWGTEAEALPFYGLLKTAGAPDEFQAEGFLRGVQTYHDSPQEDDGTSEFMQADLYFSAVVNQFTLVLSGGVDPDRLTGAKSNDPVFLSREFWLMYRPADPVSVRAGKFQMDYGIHVPDHTVSTREGLGFQPYTETYNLEAGYQGDQFSGSATAVFGRPVRDGIPSESGGVLTGAIAIAEKYKIGASYLHGITQGASRELVGPWGILGFTKQLYFLGEYDLQFRRGSLANQYGNSGLFTYSRLGYEIVQGLHIYLLHEFDYTSLNNPTTYTTAIGPGILFYPRPHVELQAQVTRNHNPVLDQNEIYGFLMGSLYL